MPVCASVSIISSVHNVLALSSSVPGVAIQLYEGTPKQVFMLKKDRFRHCSKRYR